MRGLLLGLGILLLGGIAALPQAEAQRAVAQSRSATPPASAAPAPSAAPTPRVPSARSSRSWMPVIGNLAAGGLLGALFGGNVLFGVLMVVLLIAIGAFVVRLVLRARAESVPGSAQFAGLGSETVVAPPPSQAAGMTETPPVVRSGPMLPEGFDLAGFVRSAKLNFVRLQIAIDLGNLDEIREFTTSQMTARLGKEIAQQDAKGAQGDVVSLNAELVDLSTEGDIHRASVRFSGMARDMPGGAPTGFAEVWRLARPADGSSGWLLADIERTD